MRNANQCPGCDGVGRETKGPGQLYTCKGCGGLFGSCYLGDSYTLVSPFMAREAVPAEQTRYFDLDCLGSEGLTRRHGWYDPRTKLVTQVG